ncbi:uncharacterized protein LOC141843411 [Curcuma longa]|uniref:uncharacterized protein LOC141843411 n=1 Tax=Curcuma longa TaxID=136217 RepID=UPI003D9E0ECC
MDHLAWSTNADSTAPSAVIPGWAVEAGGVILRIEARVVVRILEGDQNMMPPQLISHFCRRRISSSDVDAAAAEHAHFTISPPFYCINHGPTWEEQTQLMFSHVAANRVRPADLDLLAEAFCRYTYAVLDLFPITELVFMEFFSIVEIPITPSASASRLRYFIPPETYEYFFGGDDDIDDIQFGRGPGPASVAAVEGLQMATVGEGSTCPICLDDFEVMSQVLAMPCGHPFHKVCLMEWLKRSHSCPLCRFSLPAAEWLLDL